MKIQMQVLYLDRRLRSHQRILNISRMRVNTYENNWDECIPNVEKIAKIVQLQKAFVYLSIRFLNDHINQSEKAFEYFSGRYSSAVEGITVYQNFKDFLMDELKPMESGHPKASMST